MAFGDPTPPSKGHDSAKGILTQIKGLLHQYVDLGDSTPLAGEAKSFLNQVEDGLARLDSDSAQESPVEDKQEGGEGAESAGNSPPADFRSATKAAREVFDRGHGSHGSNDGTKTSPSGGEQSPEEEEKRKRSKAY